MEFKLELADKSEINTFNYCLLFLGQWIWFSGTLTPSRVLLFQRQQSGYIDYDAVWAGNQTVDTTYSYLR